MHFHVRVIKNMNVFIPNKISKFIKLNKFKNVKKLTKLTRLYREFALSQLSIRFPSVYESNKGIM